MGLVLFGGSAWGIDQREQTTLAGFDLSLDFAAFKKTYAGRLNCREKEYSLDSFKEATARFWQCGIDQASKNKESESEGAMGLISFYKGKAFRFILKAPQGVRFQTAVAQLAKKGRIYSVRVTDPTAKINYHSCVANFGHACQTCAVKTNFLSGQVYLSQGNMKHVKNLGEVYEFGYFDAPTTDQTICQSFEKSEGEAGLIFYTNPILEEQINLDMEKMKKKLQESADKGFKL